MTTLLAHTLAEVRAVIHRLRLTQLSSDPDDSQIDDELPSSLVEPVLFALGWNTDDEQEVFRQYKLDGFESTSTFALLTTGDPVVLLFVMDVDWEYTTPDSVSEQLSKAGASQFPWVIFTNGDRYQVYSTSAGSGDDRALFGSASVTDDAQDHVNAILDLFSRSRLCEKRIDTIWRNRLVDRQVKDAVDTLLSPDQSFVRMLSRRINGLTAKEIRSSLERAEISVNFVSSEEVALSPKAPESTSTEAQNRMSDAELRIATWLQQRSIERWAKGKNQGNTRHRTRQRRILQNRRASVDRRNPRFNRRRQQLDWQDAERRHGDRRVSDRRSIADRRTAWDRRRARREA